MGCGHIPWVPSPRMPIYEMCVLYLSETEATSLRIGSAAGGGVKAEDLADDVWDYIFLAGPEPQHSAIPAQTLQALRREFEFWYPFDLRVGPLALRKARSLRSPRLTHSHFSVMTASIGTLPANEPVNIADCPTDEHAKASLPVLCQNQYKGKASCVMPKDDHTMLGPCFSTEAVAHFCPGRCGTIQGETGIQCCGILMQTLC